MTSVETPSTAAVRVAVEGCVSTSLWREMRESS